MPADFNFIAVITRRPLSLRKLRKDLRMLDWRENCHSCGDELDAKGAYFYNAPQRSAADSDADSDAETDADSEAGSNVDSNADSDADSGAESDANSEADSDAESDADSGAESDAESDADSGAVTDEDIEADSDAEFNDESGEDSDAETDPGSVRTLSRTEFLCEGCVHFTESQWEDIPGSRPRGGSPRQSNRDSEESERPEESWPDCLFADSSDCEGPKVLYRHWVCLQDEWDRFDH